MYAPYPRRVRSLPFARTAPTWMHREYTVRNPKTTVSSPLTDSNRGPLPTIEVFFRLSHRCTGGNRVALGAGDTAVARIIELSR